MAEREKELRGGLIGQWRIGETRYRNSNSWETEEVLFYNQGSLLIQNMKKTTSTHLDLVLQAYGRFRKKTDESTQPGARFGGDLPVKSARPFQIRQRFQRTRELQ